MSLVLILLLLVASVRVARVKTKSGYNGTSSGDICSSYGFRTVEAKFGKETHFLCLKQKSIDSSPIASRDSALFLDLDYDEESEDQNYIRAYPLNNFYMSYGFPLEDPSSGSAEGYIGDDHQFYGVLHIGNRTLHADPYGKDDPHKSFGAFEHGNISMPRRRRDDAQVSFDRGYLPYQIENHNRIGGAARTRICDLLLLADKEFYEKDANSSLNHVVRRMMHAVAQADIIFRNADFNEDGIPDNIGFSVKYILVLTSNETNRRVFGKLLDTRVIDGKDYLNKFARLRRLAEVCLGVAFSGHAFHNRTLGLSFTSLGGGLGGAAGGLCDRRAYGRSFNTLAVAHATNDEMERVPERIAALTLAHEMGHSFGAHHDENFPNPECRGYLMGSQTSSASNSGMPTEFSVCSKRLIAATLSSMSYCFTEETTPYCGNGIVEEGEACDCGMPSRCTRKDPCCTPRAGTAHILKERASSNSNLLHKEGCSVAPSATCHPSQGLCCLATCRTANLTESGIDCNSQNHDCKDNDTNNSTCGYGGRCLNGSCHAAECTILGLKECQCHMSPGGSLTENRRCGICCLLVNDDKRSKCISAEQAAHEYVEKSHLPVEWPGDDYTGPNVTVRICNGECRTVELRAWRVGEPCVTRGAVGLCTARGVCASVMAKPRGNVYPDIMRVRLQQRDHPLSSARKISTHLSIPIYLVYATIIV